MTEFIPQTLPLNIDLETKQILKKSILANRALAKLKKGFILMGKLGF